MQTRVHYCDTIFDRLAELLPTEDLERCNVRGMLGNAPSWRTMAGFVHRSARPCPLATGGLAAGQWCPAAQMLLLIRGPLWQSAATVSRQSPRGGRVLMLASVVARRDEPPGGLVPLSDGPRCLACAAQRDAARSYPPRDGPRCLLLLDATSRRAEVCSRIPPRDGPRRLALAPRALSWRAGIAHPRPARFSSASHKRHDTVMARAAEMGI